MPSFKDYCSFNRIPKEPPMDPQREIRKLRRENRELRVNREMLLRFIKRGRRLQAQTDRQTGVMIDVLRQEVNGE